MPSLSAAHQSAAIENRIHEAVKRFWGYDALRPLQMEAIRAGIEHRDSLVVLPTGGGKSLCYQVPPIVAERTDVVVSPLISLMKDQVDGLVANGYPAAALHSGLSESERREIERGIAQNKYRLLFVAPERLLTSWFMQSIERLNVRAFAIDEAHCISQWGHDFRPEYRQLATLKQRFRGASVHAYTATATPRVQQDIVAQLGLENPNLLVGVFDRPNLVYRIVPKTDEQFQVIEAVRRHADEAAIVYCISRKDTENMAAALKANGIKAAAYHAGLEKEDRARVQEAFAEERLDVVVATVAFGMGIDRSNVRCVIHAAMPKTVEHYQQEAGRAGRDGLEAECIMFYSSADVMRWLKLIRFSAGKIEDPEIQEQMVQAQEELLGHVQKLCGSVRCRHGSLSRYFGQEYEKANCGACDICLGEVEGMRDSKLIAQKIISCVARLQSRFGVGHVVDVLLGADTEMIRKCGHQSLSTWGLLKEMPKKKLQNLVFQLVDQGLLDRTPGEYPVVALNDESVAILKGQRDVMLIEPGGGAVRKSKVEQASWENVDRGLFDHLREIRKSLAAARGVPAFVILGDATLRELAAVRPTVTESLRKVRGIGEKKLADLGRTLVEAIRGYCGKHAVPTDQLRNASVVATKAAAQQASAAKEKAFEMFAKGCGIAETASAVGRASSTTGQYLQEWILKNRPKEISAWVDAATYRRVIEAAKDVEGYAMKPAFDAMGGEVPYDVIRIVMTHARVMAEADAAE